MNKTEFVERIAGYVEKYAYVYGIMVHSPIIAQAILESGWGESKLASLYHNYFGLKCGSRWAGKSVNMKTSEEYEPGVHTQIYDNFRVYDSMEAGVIGYFEFIQLDRYKNLRGVTDPQQYLKNIKDDGYATSSTYVDNLMKVIRQYNLTQYDKSGKEGAKMEYSRQKVADQAEAWVGLKESDGSFKVIIDIYNSKEPFPRGTKMLYSWEWCAATWSAIAKKLGYTEIMPVEISCYYIIEEAKKMGCWQENDAYVPNIGDACLYDWEDSGVGDNMGGADHIGTVTYVNRSAGYFVVTEGNNSGSVKKRTVSINGRYIRGFITPHYTDNTVKTESDQRKAGKSVDTVAHEVIAEQWGDGETRKANLRAHGYDPVVIQNRVNEILNGTTGKKQEPAKPTSGKKKVTSTCYARGMDARLSGTYTATANLYCRNDAGTNKRALCCMPAGQKVHCYGYYSTANGVKWLYIQFELNGVTYTGFSSSAYLKKA